MSTRITHNILSLTAQRTHELRPTASPSRVREPGGSIPSQ